MDNTADDLMEEAFSDESIEGLVTITDDVNIKGDFVIKSLVTQISKTAKDDLRIIYTSLGNSSKAQERVIRQAIDRGDVITIEGAPRIEEIRTGFRSIDHWGNIFRTIREKVKEESIGYTKAVHVIINNLEAALITSGGKDTGRIVSEVLSLRGMIDEIGGVLIVKITGSSANEIRMILKRISLKTIELGQLETGSSLIARGKITIEETGGSRGRRAWIKRIIGEETNEYDGPKIYREGYAVGMT